jgi:hypothetical protein
MHFLCPHPRHMPRQSHPASFHRLNNMRRTVQIMDPLIMHFAPPSCHFSLHPDLTPARFVFSLDAGDQV